MITKSFIFLNRVNKRTECNVWDQGINDWDEFLCMNKIKGMSKKTKVIHNKTIMKAKCALFNYDSSFFTNMPTTETWRLYDYFRDDTVFLDLEMCGERGITVITLFDGIESKTLVRNMSLFKETLKKELSRYKLIVTFNGSSCDLPIIKKYFGNIVPNVPHIDLRHCCNRLGLTGGLKKIEKKVGIERPRRLMGGKENPYWLWKAFHASGEEEYLETLVEYNEEDTINLKYLMEYCYRELKKKQKIKLFLT